MPKLVKTAIAKDLKPYVEAKAKQHEIIETHKLRIDMLEAMIDDYGKELASLKNKAIEIEKICGGIADTSALKAGLDKLKKSGIPQVH